MSVNPCDKAITAPHEYSFYWKKADVVVVASQTICILCYMVDVHRTTFMPNKYKIKLTLNRLCVCVRPSSHYQMYVL